MFSLLEKKTENDIAIQIPGKDSASVLQTMQMLKEEFGNEFSQAFKMITVDNGPEFSGFAQVENWAVRSASPIHTHPGSVLKTSAATDCSVLSCQRKYLFLAGGYLIRR